MVSSGSRNPWKAASACRDPHACDAHGPGQDAHLGRATPGVSSLPGAPLAHNPPLLNTKTMKPLGHLGGQDLEWAGWAGGTLLW